MEILLFIGYELLTSFIPFTVFLLVFSQIRKKNGNNISRLSYLLLTIFAIYIIGVFHFTGTGTLYEVLRYKSNIDESQLNFIPFSNDIDVVAYLLNILMLIPLGFLVPIIWDRMRKYYKVLAVGASFSFLIELSQLLNNRRSDIDDLIMNSIGTVLGFMLYIIWSKLSKAKYERADVPCYLLSISIFTMFIGRFLLYNEIGLAKLLYGF